MKMRVGEDVVIKGLQKYLRYEKSTGKVFWIKVDHGRVKVGDEAGSYCVKNNRFTIRFKKKLYLLHRVIWALETGGWPKNKIDHINRNPSDNRWDNLREASNKENSRNTSKRKNTSSIYKGVCFHKENQNWVAYATVDYKLINLGSFTSEIDAANTYNEFVNNVFGEFASPNIICESLTEKGEDTSCAH